MKYKSKILFVLMLVPVISLLQSCKQKEQALTEAEPPVVIKSVVTLTDAQLKNAQIQVSVPEKMNIGHVINLNGKIEVMPENTITVSSPMAGFVRQIKWMPGMNVSKGQTLVRLEEKEYIRLQQDYLSAKNTLAYAKSDLDRQSELVKNQAASDKVLQQAEEKVKQNQIILKSLGEQLKLIHINPITLTAESMTSQMVISAPVSGAITEVMVNSGKYVQAGEEMIKMIASDGSRLVLKAFEKDLPYLKTGQKLVAFTNAQPDKKIPGNIEYIVSNVSQDGFVHVICTLETRMSNLVPGMYLNAGIEAQNMESWTLPDEAIVSFEGKEYVFVEKENKSYEMMEVTSGQRENGKTQILNFQPTPNQKIVTKGAYTLLMKMKNVSDE
jgi:membrane fusion protein, heavy metal efflux system